METLNNKEEDFILEQAREDDYEKKALINTFTRDAEPEQKPYIKITKNTKGYNWEFKILGLDVDAVIQLNEKLKENFEFQVQ